MLQVLEQIDTVCKYLASIISVCAIITWLIAFFVTGLNPIDALTTALTCAVAMIPEGLEAIVTLVYAWAVSNMAKKKCNHSRLARCRDSSVTVICSDKTGTLTKNEMSLVAFVTSNALYKNDVNSANRSSTNFVRDDSYLAFRAKGVGGQVAAPRKYVAKPPTSVGAVPPGQSPDLPFVKSALACWGKRKNDKTWRERKQ